jgi:hypothetical protein
MDLLMWEFYGDGMVDLCSVWEDEAQLLISFDHLYGKDFGIAVNRAITM